MLISKPFPCNKCGQCCQRVNLAPETHFLDRGDGVCRHYDALGKGCNIYNHRPDICRVDRQFQLIYSQRYSWEEFVAANLEVCDLLQADSHSLLDMAQQPGANEAVIRTGDFSNAAIEGPSIPATPI